MTKHIRRAALVGMLIAVFGLTVVAPALAYTATTQQLTPGMTTRTIWDKAQVAVYEITNGTNYVNHNGYIHMELTWKPSWADFDIYLLDADGTTLSEEMGYMGVFTGKEVIDYQVRSVRNKEIVTPTYGDKYMVGDKYYVAVVAFNDAAKFQIRGYYPQIDLSVGTSTTNQWNYYIEGFRVPAKKDAWVSLYGPMWGGPYAMRPTSLGEGTAQLEWPANVVKKVVSDDHANGFMPSNMEQYMFAGSDYDTVFENYGDGNWTPPALGGGRWGLTNTFPVTTTGNARPLRPMWYVPSLYLVSSDKTQGAFAPPKLGKTTAGYKATITFPENLRLIAAPRKVTVGGTATVKGSFALNGAWQAGASVQVQRQKGSTWVKVKKATVGANGRWTATFKVNTTAKYRVVATGDPATGLDVEMTRTWKITATN